MVHIADKRIHAARQASTPLGHTLSLITHASSPVRFLILDCPTESTLPIYMQEFINNHVTTVVRCCQPTYETKRLNENNIDVVDLPFKDGGVPPPAMISQWLQVVNQAKLQAARQETDHVTVAVHCVAGLGRAPVLVAIALIELGMAPLDAIAYIREKRRGAFNKPQIMFLDSYSSPTYSLRSSLGRMFGFGPKTCAVVTQQT